jgi:uncharacterized membrane protein
MNIIIFIIGLGFGLFGFSQIIYPLFVALPKIEKLQKEDKLKKPIPLYTVLLAPVIWTVLIAGSILIIQNFFSNYLNTYFVALGIILIVVIAQIPKKNKDLEVDFMETWKNYLKDDA